ncbi:MAG: ribonuclease P protein component [Ostreibacterium sp.]
MVAVDADKDGLGCCFNKRRRLRKPAEFDKVYQKNQLRVKGQYFVVLAFSRFEAVAKDNVSGTIRHAVTVGRVGVVVSKKVSKLAVQRNRVKRLIREQFRQKQHPNNVDFIVIAKPSVGRAENHQLVQELDYLWKKLYKQCVTV